MNVAYKHLEAKLRIADLTIGQWIGLFLGVVLALVFGVYLRPFGGPLTLFIAIYIGGLPVAAVLLASLSDLDVWLLTRSACRWWRMDGRVFPGPGRPTRGYQLTEPPELRLSAERERAAEVDLGVLWGDVR